ncbi:hypothetical protein E2P81_ATG08687 [Venturia nashicola]|nr:hypothetical protein E2P81_ATG08687 [Venturia nashicola]
MPLGAPRAGPYFAPRVSNNALAKAREDTQRLEARIQHLEALNKELKVEAKEKDNAMREMSETIERLKMTMEGGRNGNTMQD